MKIYKVRFTGVRHGEEQEETHIWNLTGDNEALAVASLRMWFNWASIVEIKEIEQ